MNLLLDTHALIWFLEDDARLGSQARAAISDAANRTYVSDATAWEVGIKCSLRKLALPAPYEDLVSRFAEAIGLPHPADPPCAFASDDDFGMASPRSVRPAAHRAGSGREDDSDFLRFTLSGVRRAIALVANALLASTRACD